MSTVRILVVFDFWNGASPENACVQSFDTGLLLVGSGGEPYYVKKCHLPCWKPERCSNFHKFFFRLMVTNFMGNSRLCCFARFDSRVFFTFFKSNKWYQIAQSVLFDFSMVSCWIGIGMHSLDYELLIGEVQS